MNIFRKRISLILSMVMIALAILPVFVVNAASSISYVTKMDSKTIQVGETYTVKGGEKITFSATGHEASVGLVAYYFDTDPYTTIEGSSVTVTVPTGTPGSTKTINFQAAGVNTDATERVNTPWIQYTLKYEAAAPEGKINYTTKIGSTTLTTGKTYEVNAGDKITFTATGENATVSLIAYYFDQEAYKTVEGKSVTVTVPSGTAGTTKTISFQAAGVNSDGTKPVNTPWITYTIKYAAATEPVPEGKINYTTKMGSTTLTAGRTYEVKGGEKITFSATGENATVSLIAYYFDQEAYKTVEGKSVTVTVPNATAGTTKTINFQAAGVNNDASERVNTPWITYTLKYPAAVEPTPEAKITYTATMGTTKLVEGKTYEVEGGEQITFSANGENAKVGLVAYYFDNEDYTTYEAKAIKVTLPYAAAGTTKVISFQAAGVNDAGTERVNTPWVRYILKYVGETPTPEAKEVNVKLGGKTLTPNTSVSANINTALDIIATPADKALNIYYKWDNEGWHTVNNAKTYSLRIPNSFAAGSTHWLYVKADYTDGTKAAERAYKFVIPAAVADITMNVKIDGATVKEGSTTKVQGGEDVVVNATSSDSSVSYIKYRFGTDDSVKVKKSKASFEVPDKKVGTTLKLYVEAVDEAGKTTGEKVYNLKFVDVIDGKLDVEPWMEENDEVENLVVNLRNDSEETEKANKNIYAIEEVVTYFIDYVNGSDDDIENVSIKLDLPLSFEVVSAGNGKTDKSEKTITWDLGTLEEGAKGTLVAKIKYTKFSKSKYDSETIYPVASILKGKKVKDESAVINLIIEDYDTEIKDEHEPYMFGYEDDTFRPDRPISRAEGALVLARICGLDYMNTRVTYLFSDIDDTYLEAQKAISAAANAGLINGNTDGTFKPNDKMTKAQFIKILASMVQEQGEDKDVNGLNIKSVQDSVKVYSDSTRYYIVDGKKVYTHWALEEVTLLARLNMTGLSKENDEIDLDEYITRAEVAQLVNFYLLRAPASITSKTTTGFSDVTKKHELIGDIVEATRKAHTYKIDEEDGTEIAK